MSCVSPGSIDLRLDSRDQRISLGGGETQHCRSLDHLAEPLTNHDGEFYLRYRERVWSRDDRALRECHLDREHRHTERVARRVLVLHVPSLTRVIMIQAALWWRAR